MTALENTFVPPSADLSHNIGRMSGNGSEVTSTVMAIIETSDEGKTDIVNPPDGGYGFVVVFAAFSSMMVVDGVALSFGTLKDSILESMDPKAEKLEQATLAWVGSVLLGCYYFAGPLVSALANKFGFRVVAVLGSVITSLAFILSWFLNQKGPNVAILVVCYGIIGGIGFSCIYMAAVVVVGLYFDKKRGLATGIAVCGSGVGNFVFPPIIVLMTTRFQWQGAILGLGIIVLLCALLGLLYKSLQLHGAQKTTTKGLKNIVDFSLWKSPTLIALGASSMLTLLGFMVPFVYLMDQARYALEDNGAVPDKNHQTLLISLIGAANIIGRIVIGWIADRPWVNALTLNNVAVAVMGISTVLVPFLKSYYTFVVYSILYGLATACFISLRSILIIEVIGLAKLSDAYGFVLLFEGVGATVCTPMAGKIVQLGGRKDDFSAAFYMAGGFIFLSAFLYSRLPQIQKLEHKAISEMNKLSVVKR